MTTNGAVSPYLRPPGIEQVGEQFVPAPFEHARINLPGLGGWTFGYVEDFGRRKYERLYLWD